MTERNARAQGLEFTGVYERSWNSDVAKQRAAEMRKQYKCRAILVNVDGGVSVYADKSYRIQRQIEQYETQLAQVEDRKQALREKYEAELAEIDKKAAEMQAYIADNSAA